MFSFDYRDVSFAHKLGFASSPKDEFHKHMHHFYEVIYFERGNVQFHIEGLTRTLLPGDIVFIQPGQFHFASVDREVDYQRYVCKIPEEALPPHLRERALKFGSFFASCESLAPLLEDIEEFSKQFEGEDMRSLAICKIIELLIRLCDKESIRLEEKKESVAQGLVNYIEEHLREPLDLESLADAFHYSPSYVATSFRKEMHVSLISYVRGKKIMAAHSLILHGMKPSEASALMGFGDYSTFYRTYQKYLGTAPSVTKRSNGEQDE